MSFIIFLIIWIFSWVGASFILKKQETIKQPIAIGFIASLVILNIIYWTFILLNPTPEKLLAKAQEAEQRYFVLSKGSLDHSKICGAAKETLRYYTKLADTEKMKLFEYIIVDDKCL